MLQILTSILDSIVSFFTYIYDFISGLWQKLYDFVLWAFDQLTGYLMLAFIKIKTWFLSFIWSIIQPMLSGLNISSYISDAIGSLPGDLYSAASFFNIPTAVGIILAALATRFVLKIVIGVIT